MSLTVIIAIFASALLISLLASACLYLLFHRHAQLQQETQALNAKLNTLANASIHVGDRIVDAEARLRTIYARLNTMESEDEVTTSYAQAKKLLEKGLDCHDVAITCHIPDAEARLLKSIKRKAG